MKAIPQLKKRIIVLFTALTGAVLCVACILACQMNIRQLRQASMILFSSHFNSISSQIQNQSSINIVDIYQFENAYEVIVQLYDNGIPLFLSIPENNEYRQEIVEAAESSFTKNSQFGSFTDEFQVQNPNAGKWQGKYQVIPSASGSGWYGVLLLQSEQLLQQAMFKTVVAYVFIFIGAIIALFFASCLLANIAAKPINKAYQQQMEFTTAAGHDLRTPISVIKTSAQILSNHVPEAKKDAEKIVNESNRLSALVNNLLILSAGEANILQVEIGEVDLESVLIAVYENHLQLVKNAGFTLSILFPDDILPKVKGDTERIYQILIIFLSNAMEYSSKGTDIEISVLAEKKNILVKIIDHGPGIPAEKQKLVFNQFYRADKSRTQKEHFGLGLSIAQKLAVAQDASVYVESTAGGGATFILKLKRIYPKVR